MLPSETMIWQPEFTDKTLSRKPGAVHNIRGQQHPILFPGFQQRGFFLRCIYSSPFFTHD
ncbi:TPA: hypothetical protein IVC07_23880 [Escherichia coli]|nr:hypothetical protein [Escherichia coli]HAP6034989.1 hypothetical protein [Escherichia coli]